MQAKKARKDSMVSLALMVQKVTLVDLVHLALRDSQENQVYLVHLADPEI